MNTRARVTGLGLLAGVFSVVLVLGSWKSGVAAPPAQSGQAGQTGESSGHHPEIRRALKSLRAARHELKEAKHDFGGHREEALHAVDEAIKQLEVCLQSSHGESGASNNSTQSRPNGSHFSTGS